MNILIYSIPVFLAMRLLDVEEVFNAIQTKGRLNYRNWYPNLTAEQIRNLNKENGLISFYKEKKQHLLINTSVLSC